MKEKSNLISYSSVIGSMLIFGTIGIFRRWIPLSSALLACLRGFLGAGVLLLFSLLRKKKAPKIGKSDLFLTILSGVLIGYNWVLLFEAYRYTTVATATLCYYMAPTFVILATPFLLKEKLTVKKAVCAAVAVCGMVFVSGVTDGERTGNSNVTGILFGLGAALLYTTVILLNKRIRIEDTGEKTILQLSAAAIGMIPYLLFTEDFSAVSLAPKEILLVLLVGILHTGVAYALYFGGMMGMKAQSVAVLSYLDPVTALLFSFLLLHEKLTPLGVCGAILILGAAIVSETTLSLSRKKIGN